MSNTLLDTIEEVPIVLVVTADLRSVAVMDGSLERIPMTGGASIYPFCWSILLAAHRRGLGGVLTTFLSRVEPAAAPLLGLPDDHALAATMFLGWPQHRPTRLTRRAGAEFTTVDRFDGGTFEPMGKHEAMSERSELQQHGASRRTAARRSAAHRRPPVSASHTSSVRR